MARARTGPGIDELQHLDPITGEPLAGPGRGQGPTVARSPRARRRRRLAALFALLAVASAAAAGYRATTITGLRGIEGTWRSALAVDAARAEVDRQLLEGFTAFGDREDPAGLAPIGAIGREEDRRLAAFQARLRRQVVFDGRIGELRRDMIAALQFRRLQMTPGRLQLGDSPLRKADGELLGQLRRWRLTPARPSPSTGRLRSAPAALAVLSHYGDDITNTVLVGRREHAVVAVDVDASRTSVRDFDGPVSSADVVGGMIVVVSDGTASAYPVAGLDGAARWQLPADAAFVASDRAVVWLQLGRVVTAVDARSGVTLGPPATIPPGASVVAAAARPRGTAPPGPTPVEGDLVLVSASSDDEPRRGRLDIWDPATALVVATIAADGRVVAAGRSLVAFESAASSGVGDSVLVVDLDGKVGRVEVTLPRTDAGLGAFSPDGTSLSFTAGPLAGDRAAILSLVLTSPQSVRGPDSPAAAIKAGVAYAVNGASVFWVTPNGRIATRRVGDAGNGRLLRIDPPPDLLSLSAGAAGSG